jgi:hypothetical protein
MAVISFDSRGEDWLVARWAYKGFLAHARRAVAGDRELEGTIDQAAAFDGLHFEHIDDEAAQRLLPVLVEVAGHVVAGRLLVSVEGRVLDERSQGQFREGVGRLGAMLERYWRRRAR